MIIEKILRERKENERNETVKKSTPEYTSTRALIEKGVGLLESANAKLDKLNEFAAARKAALTELTSADPAPTGLPRVDRVRRLLQSLNSELYPYEPGRAALTTKSMEGLIRFGVVTMPVIDRWNNNEGPFCLKGGPF